MKNINKYYLAAIFFILSNSVFAQSTWNYVKPIGGNYRDDVRKIAKDKMGNIYLAGLFTSDSFYFHGIKIKKNLVEPSEQVFLIKITPLDSLLWFKTFGVIGQEEGCDITTDTFNNVYISYYSNPNSNTSLVKLNSSGTTEWTKIYPNTKGKSILCSFNDKIIFANKDSIYSYFPSGQKINARREPLVSAFFNDPTIGFYYANANNIIKSDEQLYSLGSTSVANEQNIKITSFYVDSNFVYSAGTIGTTFTNGNFTATGAQSMFVFKQHIYGAGLWLKSASGQMHVIPHKLIQLNNRTLVCGQYRNFATFDTVSIGAWGLFEEAFVVGYHSTNGKLLDIAFGGGGGDEDIAHDMLVLTPNEVMVVGVVHNPPNGSPYFGNIKVNSMPGAADGFYASLTISKPQSRFSGEVLRNALPFVAKVRLYKYLTSNTIKVFSETNTDDVGKYSFSFSDTGTFFVKAFDQGGTFIDTYEPTNFRWENATKHKFNTINTLSNINITILEPLATTGIDTISGTVLKANNDPLRFIRVILTDTNYVFINFTKTDTFGRYDFYKVPLGVYNILLDTTGVILDSFYTVTVDSNYKNFSYDYVLVNNNLRVVHNLTSAIENFSNRIAEIKIYPNPAKDKIKLAYSGKIVSYRIINQMGKLIMVGTYTDKGISVEQLPKGVYFIQVLVENNKQVLGKFIIY